jgi:hypothetical protein
MRKGSSEVINVCILLPSRLVSLLADARDDTETEHTSC